MSESDTEISAEDFFKKSDISLDEIARAYAYFLKVMHHFIHSRRLDEKVTVNRHALKEAILDYYVDTERIREFHHIKSPSDEKKYAYEAYWVLKRKPLQIISEYKKSEFINEVFVTSYITAMISKNKNIGDEKKKENKIWEQFKELLFYNLKYRYFSQQSLELMIKAFFCGCDFGPVKN